MSKLLNKKRSSKGFTLVEVIVVLVILAILAAILIPALTGYIDKANQRRVIAEARSVYIAAQTTLSEAYGDKNLPTATGTTGTATFEITSVTTTDADDLASKTLKLSEVTFASGNTCEITYETASAKITKVEYVSGSYTAKYENSAWTVSKGTATTTNAG